MEVRVMQCERDYTSLIGFEDGGEKGATIQATWVALEAEDNPPATSHQPSRKQRPQSFNHMELNLQTTLRSLEADFAQSLPTHLISAL